MTIGREDSNPFSDFGAMIKEIGHNQDVFLAFAEVINAAPVTVRIEKNNLETSNLTLLNHLHPQMYPVQIIFDDELGTRSGHIMVDNGLEEGDRVAIIYEVKNNKVRGFIIDKEG